MTGVFRPLRAHSADTVLSFRVLTADKIRPLTEMRVFLESIQQVTTGITANDMQLVAEYARKSGKAAQGDVPGTLVGKLPVQFKKLGFDTHAKFDQLALDAEEFGDGDHALSQLSILMKNCTACHAAFRFDISDE